MSVPAFGSGACQRRERPDERGSGLDRGDLDLGRVLTVTLTLAVSGLVLELHDRDLGTLGGLEHLGGDLDLGELAHVGGHSGSIDEQERRQLDAVTGLALHLVDDEDVADGHFLLTAACANDRVHVGLTLLRLFGEVATGNRHIVSEETRARWAHRGVRLLAQQAMNQTHRWPRRDGRHRGEAQRVPRRADAFVDHVWQALSPRPPGQPASPRQRGWARQQPSVVRRSARRRRAQRQPAGRSPARQLEPPRKQATWRTVMIAVSTSRVQPPPPEGPGADPPPARWRTQP